MTEKVFSCVSCVSPTPQQRQETNKSIPHTSSMLLSAFLSVFLLLLSSLTSSVFTHQPHLSKQPFKLLEVEIRAIVGGTAAGSLTQPEHCVKHLRYIDRRVCCFFLQMLSMLALRMKEKKKTGGIITHIFQFAVAF